MIEVDPRWYFPASYVLHWCCPHCGEHLRIPNGALDRAHCPRCEQPLTHEAAAAPEPARLSA
jgi:uncharacterized paraquat-inducible protein A